MNGWLVDALVGWVIGSVVGATILGVAFAVASNDDGAIETAGTVGVVIGTIGGIYAMRRWRAARDRRSSPTSTDPSS